ncbi:MAG: hypothetical protein ACYTAN_00495 [Planctomycetota bacterium]|jgi:hypothetical protein
MGSIGEFLFKYFEKALAVLFGIALLVSVVLYGPWMYSVDYDERLADIARELAERPRILADDIPAIPDYESAYDVAGKVEGRGPYELAYFWNILPIDESAKILPPTNLMPAPSRGLVLLEWEHNPNQPKTEGKYQFQGVEIQRAEVIEGEVGKFASLTTSGERRFYLPAELHENNLKYAPLVPVRERRARQTGATGGLTTADLFDAVHDGQLRLGQVPSIIRRGIPRGEFTTTDLLDAQETVRGLMETMREMQMERRRGEGAEGAGANPMITVLEEMGFKGGGKYGQQQQPVAGGPADRAPKVRITRWAEITRFYDSDVNPDNEYVYQIRFWATDISKTPHEFKQTKWDEWQTPVSPKPDSEFYLYGGSLEIGRPWIVVRKWVPATSKWLEQEYPVAIGEEIGRKETLPKMDTVGNLVRDKAGVPVTEEVDFSTQCVLLAFQSRPRVTSAGGPTASVFAVDISQTASYPIVSELRIVYSDRKGELKAKWQAPPGSL